MMQRYSRFTPVRSWPAKSIGRSPDMPITPSSAPIDMLLRFRAMVSMKETFLTRPVASLTKTAE